MVPRRSLHVVAFVLVFGIVEAPIGDVLAFGLHDHVAGAEGDMDTGHLRSDNDAGGVAHTAPHHCELSMNPGAVIDVRGPVTPGPAGNLAPRPMLLASQFVPFIPQLPPRP